VTMPANNPYNEPTARPDSQWFLRYEESGRIKVERLSAAQILAGLKADKFNDKVQASMQAAGPFLPLVQIPVFEREMRKLLVRLKTNTHNANLSNEYKKLAKQYERLSVWRKLRKAVDDTLGLVGVLIWIGVLIAIGAAVYFFVPAVWQMIADWLGLSTRTP